MTAEPWQRQGPSAASAGRSTNGWSNQGPPKSSLPFVQSHVTHTVLHSQCNQTYDTLQTRSFTPSIALPLWCRSFFVLYKLLYLTINRNKWGHNQTLVLLFLCNIRCSGVVCVFLQMALLRTFQYLLLHMKTWKWAGMFSSYTQAQSNQDQEKMWSILKKISHINTLELYGTACGYVCFTKTWPDLLNNKFESSSFALSRFLFLLSVTFRDMTLKRKRFFSWQTVWTVTGKAQVKTYLLMMHQFHQYPTKPSHWT